MPPYQSRSSYDDTFLKAQVDTKSDKTVVDAISARVGGNETNIVTLQNLGKGLVSQVIDSNGTQSSQVTITQSGSANSAEVTKPTEGLIATINAPQTSAAFTSKLVRGKNFILSRQGIVVGIEEDDEEYATSADLVPINAALTDVSYSPSTAIQPAQTTIT